MMSRTNESAMGITLGAAYLSPGFGRVLPWGSYYFLAPRRRTDCEKEKVVDELNGGVVHLKANARRALLKLAVVVRPPTPTRTGDEHAKSPSAVVIDERLPDTPARPRE